MLTRLCILLALLLLPVQGWGAIALDNAAAQTELGGGTTLTISGFSAASGSVLTLSVICDNQARSITSVSYNGATWTPAADLTNDGAGVIETWLYLTHQGADGSPHDVVVTFDTALGGNIAHAIVAAWSGVVNTSTAAMYRSVFTDGTASGDLNITVTDSVSGDVVVHGVGNYGTNIAVVETAVASSPYLNVDGANHDHAVQYKTATGASTAMAVTGGQFGEAWALALIPSGGGGGGGATPRNLMLMGVGQ